jgi:hypothetical protein
MRVSSGAPELSQCASKTGWPFLRSRILDSRQCESNSSEEGSISPRLSASFNTPFPHGIGV